MIKEGKFSLFPYYFEASKTLSNLLSNKLGIYVVYIVCETSLSGAGTLLHN